MRSVRGCRRGQGMALLMANMERGFGWHYPPGTPGPRSESQYGICSECEKQHPVQIITDLGTSEAIPEESPCCGAEWEDDGWEMMDEEDIASERGEI